MASVQNNYAAIWPLTNVLKAAAKPESAFGLGPGGVDQEALIGGVDGRTIVSPQHFASGGKYRSIIKLLIRYKDQPDDNSWGMGTGWLIGPDLLVTAGHCSFDFGEDTHYGPATIVKAYMGYSGKANLTEENLDSGAVQMRMGAKFLTTTGWLQSNGTNRRSDVSFLKLDRPFDGEFTPFNYRDTPLAGSDTIGVVGYPADRYDVAMEHGARMYEMFAKVNWNLDKDERNMLAYPISTTPGQSGSPVIRISDGASIGAHVYGGHNLNSASTIRGKYGNDFDAYVQAFSESTKPIKKILGISVYKPSMIGVDNLASGGREMNGSSEAFIGESENESPEGFLDTLKVIGRVAAPLINTGLQIASPFLGPAGAPIAGIAGVALGALGKMCESAFDPGTQTLHMVQKITPEQMDGCAQRAVLAEAALQAALKLDDSHPEAKKIIQSMKKSYATMTIQKSLPSKLFPCIAAPALRIAMDQKVAIQPKAPLIRKPLPQAGLNAAEAAFYSPTEAAFAKELLAPTLSLPGEEGFFDTMAPIIKKGLKYATPFLKQAAKDGIDAVLADWNSTEAAIDTTTSDSILAEPLFKRAIVAECALQAVQKVEPSKLNDIKLIDVEGNEMPEGFFDFMKGAIQVVGRQIAQTAPDVIRNVGPVALDLLANAIQKKAGAEGAFGLPSPSGSSTLSPPLTPGLTRKKSIGTLAAGRPDQPKPVTTMA
ncbi:trypsin-like serine protease [Acephala macrosclerotiorum]|nr:trypsin-like serine protease [Acephala macrosclerotiorum]